MGCPLTVRIRVRSVVRVLGVLVVVLAVAGALSAELRLAGYPTAFGFVNFFDLDTEMSAPTWFSAGVLLACAAALALSAIAAGRVGDRRRRHWWMLAALFVAMSLDEVVGFHETWVGRLRSFFDAGGIFYFTWVIPGSLIAAAIALALVPFLRSLPRQTALRFVVAGAIYLGGALGVEMGNGWYFERHGGANRSYAVLAAIEEVLEMVGAIAFLRALLLHLGRTAETVQLVFVSAAVSTSKALPTSPSCRPSTDQFLALDPVAQDEER